MSKEKEEFLDKFRFTSCDECVHKIDGVYQMACCECRHYYGCLFEKKEEKLKID